MKVGSASESSTELVVNQEDMAESMIEAAPVTGANSSRIRAERLLVAEPVSP